MFEDFDRYVQWGWSTPGARFEVSIMTLATADIQIGVVSLLPGQYRPTWIPPSTTIVWPVT
jgi:hypothetical protein